MTFWQEPTQIYIGDTVEWSRSLTDYVASDGWTLHYSLKNKDSAWSFEATADGNNFSVSVDAATTGGWTEGNYMLVGYVDNDTERHIVYTGQVNVLPDLTSAEPYDGRSHNRRVWESIRAVIEKRASADVQRYMINGRELQKMTIAELKAFEQDYAHRVAKEEGKLPKFMGATWA